VPGRPPPGTLEVRSITLHNENEKKNWSELKLLLKYIKSRETINKLCMLRPAGVGRFVIKPTGTTPKRYVKMKKKCAVKGTVPKFRPI
jgi:hypothetical protein